MATASLRKALFQTASRKLTPLAAHIDLTYRCNFRCTHCYIPEHAGPELSTTEVFGLLDDLARTGTMFLVLSGGEVFLRRDLFQILERTRKLGFHVRLFTDGYFVDERNADRLASLHIPEVHVSLYSTNAERFDAITQVPGSLDRVLHGIELLRERDIKVTLKNPVMKGSAPDALAVLDWANAHGCDTRFDTAIIPQRDGCADPVITHTMDDVQLRQVLSDLNAARNEVIRPYEPGSRDDSPLCGAGRSTVHIEPSGQVNPCVILPRAAGNLHEHSFAEIWRDAPVLQEIRGYTQKDRSGCRGCMNMGFCNFCMGRAYLSTGDSLSPAAVLCTQSQARADIYRGTVTEVDAQWLRTSTDPTAPWDTVEPRMGPQMEPAPTPTFPAGLVQIRPLARRAPSVLSAPVISGRAPADDAARVGEMVRVGETVRVGQPAKVDDSPLSVDGLASPADDLALSVDDSAFAYRAGGAAA